MYNKLGAGYKKRFHNHEDEPPEKKLISDGDILIKQLAEKQRNTKLNLEEQLSSKSQFYKSTEEISVTNYTSGSKTLEEFNSVIKHSNEVEKLKSFGFTNEEIGLYLDFEKGEEYMKNRHKNINENVLKNRIENIFAKMKEPKTEKRVDTGRLTTELILSTKPNSVETKLLKFALENKKLSKETLPGPMDHIKDIEKEFQQDLVSVNVKKIRRKARSLKKQIDTIETSVAFKPKLKQRESETETCFVKSSKWDINQEMNEDKNKKVHTCKALNYYTIKDGQIVKITPPDKQKLTIDEIKQLPKFVNYDKGEPSKVLYLKNLHKKVDERDLENIFRDFSKSIVSINITKGRMQGQAFIEFSDLESGETALNQCNGIILKNKPVIIQFGKTK